MNRINLFIVAITMLITTTVSCQSKQEKNTTEQKSKTTIDVIHERSSIRSYTDQKVTKEQLETIVHAGMAAPSAVNKQPWQFVIIDDKETLLEIGNLQYVGMAKEASAAIVVCGDLSKALEGWAQEYWIQDCSAATQNILLAITDLGLGGVWTGVHPNQEKVVFIKKLLSLPEHVIPLCVIPIGYPAGENKPKDKWKPENVHWNKW